MSDGDGDGDDRLERLRTREFSSVRVDPDVLAALDLDDDPAESSGGSVDREPTRLERGPKP